MTDKLENIALEHLCDFIDRRGVTPEKLGSSFRSEGFRVISARNIKDRRINTDIGEQRFVDENTYHKWMNTPLEADDVLLTSEAPLGEPAYVEEKLEWCLGQRLFGIRTNKEKLHGRFLFYAIQSSAIRHDLLSRATGATAQGIRQSELKKVFLPVPSLPEQHRIVAILDEAFEAIGTAKANAEKNLQNAGALFESHLHSVFTERGEGFDETTLGKVCEFVGGSQPPKEVFEKEPTADNIRLIQIRDYKTDKHIVFIPRSMAKRFCSVDDVMIGRYGPPLFQILRGISGAYNVALMKAVPNESRLSRDYLFYFLKHSDILQFVIYHSDRAAGQIGVTKETLEPYPIAVPSHDAQERAVGIIMELESETQRLESIYQQKIAALDDLKKSLLHKAFTGAL